MAIHVNLTRTEVRTSNLQHIEEKEDEIEEIVEESDNSPEAKKVTARLKDVLDLLEAREVELEEAEEAGDEDKTAQEKFNEIVENARKELAQYREQFKFYISDED